MADVELREVGSYDFPFITMIFIKDGARRRQRRNMKQILSVFMKRLAIALALATLMIGSLLFARGEGMLIGALLLGYLAALVFVWNMAWRLWRLTYVRDGGKRQMLWGMALRMLVLFLVLLVAVTISVPVFLVTALGFLVCYGMALFLFIHMNLGKK